MSVMADRWIRKMATEHRMIEPFHEKQVRDGVISYGLSSYGYDARIADEFKIFTNINHTIVDPKDFDPRSFVDFQGKECIIPPNSFALARTVEYFRIPRNVIVCCLGKSTYARCGIIVNVTPPVLRGQRGVRDFLRRQEGEVPGAAGPHAAARLARWAPRQRWSAKRSRSKAT